MKACILAIGSEMLTPFRVDTNSLFITDRLNTIGYDVRLKAVVADRVQAIGDEQGVGVDPERRQHLAADRPDASLPIG